MSRIDLSRAPTRRAALASLAVLAAFAAGPFTGAAMAYPDRPVTVVVPFPPGGASDSTARLVAAKMPETLGQSVVIDNRPGANGATGAQHVKNSPADGYTLLVGSIGVFAINSALNPALGYDPKTDFDLVTVAVRTPNVLVATPSFPANSVKELVDYLKKNPDKVTFASSGVGSSDHLTAALFWQKTGTSGIHVPYKGGGPAIGDLIAGHADVSFQNLGAVANHIKAGKLKVLGVTAAARNPVLPDVPTMKEAGVDGLEVYSWQAAAAPKGLPADVKAKVVKAFAAGLAAPDVKAKFNEMGFEVVANTPEEFAAFQKAEEERWRQVVKAGNIVTQ
ncbi:Bug family tripartite tricarboxylate transporter substrate binding protein [Ancylobacter oerskovii]|uniref:Bug family tripartite tricarboxylate transporter substrate binding protein n=1 Tax=Ancylobacter oerskovii TaxID=459519 RepID=A0ABW4Z3N2_9HYPH|nr:tripartite tricarboxylate transporter substrate binding protein [Ancylobacter oerskovii]MBS7546138.1 tripartite tricarboxylate transporter substrate binding protein [Ancylobacter oerskovii]